MSLFFLPFFHHFCPMMNQLQSRQWAMFVLLIGIAAISRALPHPPNFTPIGGMALFAGAVMPHLAVALLLPLASLIIGDYLFLGGGYEGSWVVYLSFAMITLFGRLGLKHFNQPLRIFGSALLASLFFFITTNLAVWYGSNFYTQDFAGLTTCYTMALPFFGNSIAGDVFFSAFFFASWKWIARPNNQSVTNQVV